MRMVPQCAPGGPRPTATAATVAATAKFALLLFAIPVSLTNLVRCVRLGPTAREPHT
jgi:hypothetical protein